jgi:phosphoglycolate phosphatase-like HAD superfamily hydrolase
MTVGAEEQSGTRRRDARRLLLLFDCDGTLFVGEDPLARPCMVDALSELSRVALPEDAFDEFDHTARTARWLARETIVRRRLPRVDLDRWVERVLELYFERLDGAAARRWRAADGAESTLDRLAREGYRLALLTGVPEEIARVRIDTLGLRRFFPRGVGAFGCEAEERADLLELALRRSACAPEDAVQIGDTSRDVRTAREAGLASVAVDFDSTGLPRAADAADALVHSMDELPEALRTLEATRRGAAADPLPPVHASRSRSVRNVTE